MREDVINSTDFTTEQEALLELLLAQEGIQPSTIQNIKRRTDEALLPLSFAQQRLWFLDQLIPDSALYIISAAFRLQGELDRDAFERALNEIVSRHEVLRTNFVFVDGKPAQTIAATRPQELSVIDLQYVPVAERAAEAQLRLQKEARKPFDLTRDALLRTTLLQLDTTEYIFLVTTHHIISDTWSENLFIQEISTLYTAFVQGQTPSLSELPIQYADFSLWQRHYLQGEVHDQLVNYWKHHLEGLSPLELPTDRPRLADPHYNGAQIYSSLPATLVQRLRVVSKQENATLFMTLLAAFQALLARYSGQDDIAVGSPIANRTLTELEGLIGFFANTLVLRTDLSGNPSFRTVLERVRETLLDAYAHQDLPFEHLVEELRVPRDPSRNPLFQVLFNMENTPHTHFDLPQLTLQTLPLDSKIASFDLVLFLEEDGDELHLLAEYSTELFDEATISRLLGHYQTLLEGIVENPARSLTSLPLLTVAEREQLLVSWNKTEIAFPPARCVHHLIEEQVERTPDLAALVAPDGEPLSYRDLNRRANQLAHHLIALGVEPGARVGIHLPRSLDAFVALLAILKAGAAYVPIDPANPKDRIAFMLEDAQVFILLTHGFLRAALPEHHAQTLCLDLEWSTIATASTDNPHTMVGPDHLLYAMYTSGSTGKPKGVAMSHRALYNLLQWQLSTMVPPRAPRMLQFASLSFDVSYQEIFPPLSAGGTIFLITEELRRDPLELLRFISQQRIEKLYLPVVALQQLSDVSSMELLDLSQLREITAAGEQLQITPQVIRFFQRASSCTLHNFYGPTETHGVTIFTLTGDPTTWPSLVPIGKPIANDQVYVLDPSGYPLPIGVIGELYLGGIGVADGYLNRPELTAERFVPDAYGPRRGVRLYKTGDLARYRVDGNLEFLGRIDHQVKVRGFRVELEEIEAVLNQHPAVRESVVVVREDVPGDKRLVAYLVTEEQQHLPTRELRNNVLAQLPEYMVPSSYVFLEAFPLTINRKVDQRRLPAPDQERPALVETFVAARTATEQQLVQMWIEILRLERVGVHDNFFELGGHSLLITQVVSRIRDIFGIDLPVRSFFGTSTIALIAERIDQAQQIGDGNGAGTQVSAPTITRASRQRVRAQVSKKGELTVTQTEQ